MNQAADRTAKRRTVMALAAGVLAAIAGVGFIVARPVPASSIADLEVIEDRVELTPEGSDEFEEARTGQSLEEGIRLRTDRTGLAAISYADGSLTRVGPSTEFELTTLRTGGPERQIVGRLEAGQTFHRVTEVTGSSSRFEVETSKAVAAVRGTEFAVQCVIRDQCEIGVVEGRVAVRTPDGREVEVPAGRRVTVTGEGQIGRLELLSRSDPWIETNQELDRTGPTTPERAPEDDAEGSGAEQEGGLAAASEPVGQSTRPGSAPESDDDEGAPGAGGGSQRTTTTRDFSEGSPQPDRLDGSDDTTTTSTTRGDSPTTTQRPDSATSTTRRSNTSTTQAQTTTTRPTNTTSGPGRTTSTAPDDDPPPPTTTSAPPTTAAPTTAAPSTTTTTRATTTTEANPPSTASSSTSTSSTATTQPSCLESPPPCRPVASNGQSGAFGWLSFLSFFSLLGGVTYATSRKDPWQE
jgi:hypothetical protein